MSECDEAYKDCVAARQARVAKTLEGAKPWETEVQLAAKAGVSRRAIQRAKRLLQKAPTDAKPVSDKRQRAFDAYDRIKAREGRKPIFAEVQEEAGVSNTVARAVFTARETEEQVRAKGPELTKAEREALIAKLPAKDRAWLEEEATKARAEATAQVRHTYNQWKDQNLALYMKRVDDLIHMLSTPSYAVMYAKEYNIILRCLHPDTAGTRSDADRAEAFRLFTRYKLKFINDEEERIEARRQLRSQLPKTLEEMLARKRTKTV
jgi:hypothetical protein